MLQIVGPIKVKNMFNEEMTLECPALEYISSGQYAELPGEKWFPHYVEGVVWELYFKPGDGLTWSGCGGDWIPVGYDGSSEGKTKLQDILSRTGDSPVWIQREPTDEEARLFLDQLEF